MHSIYQSEIAHFYGQKATALQAMLRKSMTSTDRTDRALTKQALDDYPTTGADAAKLALYYMATIYLLPVPWWMRTCLQAERTRITGRYKIS